VHIVPYGDMADPEAYRVVVRARNKPGVGYTYLLTRLDDPAWSHGTTIYYPSPEAASEAGRVALQGYSWLDKSNWTHFDDRHPAASVETPPSDHYRLCRSWRSGGRRRVFQCDPLADAHQPAVLSRRAPRARVVEPGQVKSCAAKPRLVGPDFSTRAVVLATQGT
jgi:hypothetical protein